MVLCCMAQFSVCWVAHLWCDKQFIWGILYNTYAISILIANGPTK